MLQLINRRLEKAMPFITPSSVLLGVLLSPWLKPYSFLVPWIFAFMTFSGSLGSNFKDLRKVITNPLPILMALLILHLVMPVIAWGLGHAIFSGDPFTITGLILAVVIPTGITSFIWVSIYRGNIVLALSIILIDTLFSPFLVPYSLSLFVGAKVHMDVWAMMKELWWMIVFPSLLGMLLNQATSGQIKNYLGSRLAPFSKVGLGVVIAINSAVIAPNLMAIDWKLISIAVFVLLVAALGYLFGWLTGKYLKWDRDVIVTLTFNGGMRNISAGTVLAITYFPAPVAVPVVIGMLFQQFLATSYGHMLHRYYGTGENLKEYVSKENELRDSSIAQ